MKRLIALLLSVPLLSSSALTVTVNLDLEKRGERIEPFIYGQFIEHLGRCIYGGIWAEMLEDRKFYFPVTEDYDPYVRYTDTDFPVIGSSPWEILGDASKVSMDAEVIFTGRHSPRLKAGVAIRQNDLGVGSVLEFPGYAWFQAMDGAAQVEVAMNAIQGRRVVRDSRVFQIPAGDGFIKRPFVLSAPEGATEAQFEIRVLEGEVVLGPPSLMPADNVNGMRRDTLALLKQLDSPVYRWPGGNFVSGYNWRDGIGDRDRRPPRKNPAWTGVEHNDFGTDEFIAFCRELGTEPMIAANTGLGDAYSAAQWVEYCNRPADSAAGQWRAMNGNPEPYNVQYWCVGNEMFGTWQLGWMQLRHYIIKHNEVAKAMWDVDPDLQLVGVGDLAGINRKHDPDQAASGKTWSHGMLQGSGDYMTHISEHFYRGRVQWADPDPSPIEEYVTYIKESIREKAEGHRALQARIPELNGRIIPIALDEWNYWHGESEYAYGELGCHYDLKDGLGIAMGLHEYFRQSDIIKMAHYAQTVNVIGAIKTTRTEAEMESTGLALMMYRQHFGSIPLKIEDHFAPLDIMAALNETGDTLTVGVVNPTSEVVTIELHGVSLGSGKKIELSGPHPEAKNSPGQPRQVDITEHAVNTPGSGLKAAPLSSTIFKLPLLD